jgi:hypothetical protein
MSKGLSKNQLRILGIATAMNRFTQNGTVAVKSGPSANGPFDLQWRKLIHYPGVADINYTLAAHWIYDIPFGPRSVKRLQKLRDGSYEQQEYIMRSDALCVKDHNGKSAAASLKRSFKCLIERGMLVQFNGFHFYAKSIEDANGYGEPHRYHWGALLTNEGLSVGLEHEETPQDLIQMADKLRFGWLVKTFHVREVLENQTIAEESKRTIRDELQRLGIDFCKQGGES